MPAGSGVFQVQLSHPDRDALQAIVEDLLERRLIACGQLLGPVSSTFRWQGVREQQQEWLALLKTAGARVPAVQARVIELHPYEVPEVLVCEMSAGNGDYLRWVLEQTADL